MYSTTNGKPGRSHILRTILVVASLGGACGFLATCGGGGGSTTSPTPSSNPVPGITGLSPSSAIVGAAAQTLTINGTNFLSSSTVTYNKVAHTAAFVSSTQLTIPLSASDQATGGSYPVVVTNPSPGGGPSSASMFTVLSSYLSVNIIDLPRGALADVTVTGPDGLTLSLTASQTIPNPEGTFAITANGVAVGSSRYYATKPSQSVTVAAGSATTVTVDYYDIIPNTTKVLDPTGMQSLAVSSDGSTLTISSESAVAASLEAGNILATAPTTAAPNGLLNKVQQVTTSGSNVVVNVTPATLADAVQQAKFTFNQAIAPSNAMTAKKVLPGVRILQKPTAPRILDGVSNPCSGNSQTTAEMFSVPLYQKGSSSIVGSGEIDVCPSIEFDINIGLFHVNSMTASATLAEYAQVSLQGSGTESVDQETDVATVDFDTVVVFLGSLPVVVTPTATFFVGASGDLSAGFYTGISQQAQATAGLSYANGQTTPVSQVTFTAAPDPLSLDASLDLKGYAGVQLGLELYGTATPYFSPDAYLQFNADINSNPWWTLQAGLEGSAGVDVSILDDTLATFGPYPVFDYPIATLAQASGGFSVSSAAPTLTTITPSTATSGSSTLTLALAGSNFLPDSVVDFNGSPIATAFVDTNDLTATLPSADLITVGAFPVTVSNPDTAGAVSGAVNFTVTASGVSNPVPSISSLSPSSLAVGATPQILTINGAGFLSNSTVTYNGITHTPTFVSATELTISLTAADLDTAGSFPVVVTNPAPGGGSSNTLDFTVQAAGTQNPTEILVSDSAGQLWKTQGKAFDAIWIGSLPAVMSDIAAYNGSLYGISQAPSGGFSTLYSINPSSGSGTAIGSGTGVALNALAFSPSGTLYAAGGDSLYTIDITTGMATEIGSGAGAGAYTSSGDLEFDGGGNLYLPSSGTSGDQLFSMDPTTGQGTLIGNIGYSQVYGLAYFNGVMYGFAASGSAITINLATGAGTQVCVYNLSFEGATAIAPPTPPSPQTLLADAFTTDTSLNASLWSTGTTLLQQIAEYTGSLTAAYEQPVLAFSNLGMSMSGTNSYYQFTGVQSNMTMAPPFTFQTTVETTVDYGSAIQAYLVSGDRSQAVFFSANLAPASGFYGMDVDLGPIDGGGYTVYPNLYDGTVSTWYLITFKFDENGYADATLSDASGNSLASTVPFYVGKGPFYVVLGQFEGGPDVSGPQTTIWQSVSVTTP